MIIRVFGANSSYEYEDGAFNIEYIEWRIKAIKEEAVNYYEIDLRDVKTYDDIVYKFGKVFRGKESVLCELMGNSPDSLSDTARDYFEDAWAREDTVVVRGWEHANNIDFGLCQMIPDILVYRYMEDLEYKLKVTLDQDDNEYSLSMQDVLDGVQKCTRMYILMR